MCSIVLQGLEVSGTTVECLGKAWDLKDFELASHRRDRQAKELVLAFTRDAAPGRPATELDLVLAGVRCVRLVERDVPGPLVVERLEFVRNAFDAPDPAVRGATLGESAETLLAAAGVADMAVGECVHVAFGALDVLASTETLRCATRTVSAGAPPRCDHGLCLRVSSKNGRNATVLPSGAPAEGVLEGCGDPEGLACRLCLRCGHVKILDDVARFDLRTLNTAVKRAEAAAIARRTCARCNAVATGDVSCTTCGSVCDRCGRDACKERDGHRVDLSKADFRCAAARSPRRRSSMNKDGVERHSADRERDERRVVRSPASTKPLQLHFNMTLYESMRALSVSKSRDLVQG